MKNKLISAVIISAFLFSGCRADLAVGPTQDKDITPGGECQISSQCLLPGEYAARSNCPYSAFCENNQCVIACPMWQSASSTEPGGNCDLACEKTADCSCRDWDQEGKYRCACLDGRCVSVVLDYYTPVKEEFRVPILIYHHIESKLPPAKSNSRTFYVTPEEFETQLKYLKENGFQAVSTEDLARAFAGKFELPQKPLIITFDDGLPSQYEKALPLLEKYGLTATFYIFSNAIGISENYLNWEQVKEMSAAGMEIGSHTRYHHYLTREASRADLEMEIFGSKEKIEKELGKKITAFSYPFGDYDATSTETIKAAGYLTARDIVNGATQTAEGLFQLKAYFVTSDFERFKRIVETNK